MVDARETPLREAADIGSGGASSTAHAPGRAAQATLVLVGSLVVLATAVIAPALPAIEAHFSGDPGSSVLVRLIITLPALVIAVSAPFAGYVLDRSERRPIVFWALIGFVIFGTAGVAVDSLEALLATRAGLGLSVAFLMAGFTSLVGDLFEPEQRAAIMGRQVSANSVMALSMIFAAGALTQIDWHAAFLIYLVAAPLVAAFWIYVPNPPRALAVAPAAPDGGAQRLSGTLVAVYALAIAGPLLFLLIPTQAPFLIAETHGGTSLTIAIAMGASTLGVLPGSLLFPRLRKAMSPFALFGVAFAVMGAGFVLQGLAPSLALLIAAMGIAGVGFGLMMPNLSTTLLAAAPPAMRGRLSGGLVSSIFLGQFLSPLASQPLVSAYGYEQAFITAGCAFILVAGIAALGGRLTDGPGVSPKLG